MIGDAKLSFSPDATTCQCPRGKRECFCPSVRFWFHDVPQRIQGAPFCHGSMDFPCSFDASNFSMAVTEGPPGWNATSQAIGFSPGISETVSLGAPSVFSPGTTWSAESQTDRAQKDAMKPKASTIPRDSMLAKAITESMERAGGFWHGDDPARTIDREESGAAGTYFSVKKIQG
jgi:hypothetical protein